MRWTEIILNNFWPKLIALALAVATWFYVFDIINTDSFVQKKQTAEEILSHYNFVVKEIPVKVVFSGKSPEGYRMVFDKVKIEPPRIAVFGPEDILNDVTELETDKINLGEYTRSVQLHLGLHSDTEFLQIKDKVVDVYLLVEPVEVVEEAKE